MFCTPGWLISSKNLKTTQPWVSDPLYPSDISILCNVGDGRSRNYYLKGRHFESSRWPPYRHEIVESKIFWFCGLQKYSFYNPHKNFMKLHKKIDKHCNSWSLFSLFSDIFIWSAQGNSAYTLLTWKAHTEEKNMTKNHKCVQRSNSCNTLWYPCA